MIRFADRTIKKSLPAIAMGEGFGPETLRAELAAKVTGEVIELDSDIMYRIEQPSIETDSFAESHPCPEGVC